MEFNQDNKVIQLCIKGMEMEGTGQMAIASQLFNEAWRMATTDFEKFTGFLPDDGYGRMIKQGIINGMEKLKIQTDEQT